MKEWSLKGGSTVLYSFINVYDGFFYLLDQMLVFYSRTKIEKKNFIDLSSLRLSTFTKRKSRNFSIPQLFHSEYSTILFRWSVPVFSSLLYVMELLLLLFFFFFFFM